MSWRMARVSLLSLAFLAPAAAQSVKPEVVELENGMKFLLLPRREQRNQISAGWVAKVGSANERPGITGISHFFEHMMFKGTRTIGTRDAAKDAALNESQHDVRGKLRQLALSEQYRRWKAGEIEDPWDPKVDTEEMKSLRARLQELMKEQREVMVKDEFDEVYTRLGGDGMNAFTSHDLTFYFINVPSNKFELWAWMESGRLLDPVFREFYSERDVVHEERRMRTESSPTGPFQEQFEAMFWQSSSYSWPVIGWPSDLNSYTHEQALDYFRTYYRPNNLVGVVVGDFDVEQVKRDVRRYFGRLERGSTPPAVVTLEMPQRAEKRMNAEVEAAPQIEVRYHSVPFAHPDEAALEVLAELLNGRTGRLYRTLVEELKLATDAGARQDSRKYGGAFSFSAECKAEVDPRQVEEVWYKELARLQEEPASDEELQKVKNQSLADSFRRLENNFYLMLQLGYYEALGSWEYINDAPARLQQVTAADVQRVAKRYFSPENRSVAVYTRKAGAGAPAGEDPDVMALDPQLRPMAKQALAELAKATDAAELRAELEQLRGKAGEAPPQFKPLLDLLLRKGEEKLAELEGGAR